MKQDFINFLNALMEASPDIVEKMKTESVNEYIKILMEDEKKESSISDNAKKILVFIQEHDDVHAWKSKDIAEGLGISSRSVSGSFRTLVSKGFCEKFGKDPVIYSLTEYGKNYKFEE